jgi:NmrA-like family
MGCSKSKPAAEEKKDIAAGGESASAGHPKVVVVFGATGQQGGSVVRAMKDDKNFVLKAVTRNPESEKAKQLASQGNALVQV